MELCGVEEYDGLLPVGALFGPSGGGSMDLDDWLGARPLLDNDVLSLAHASSLGSRPGAWRPAGAGDSVFAGAEV
jgi:hypothetical protein